jgi:hypothetical protein
LYQGILLVAYRIFSPVIAALRGLLAGVGRAWTLVSIVVTFQFACLGWLIFRADSVGQSLGYLHRIVFELGDTSAAVKDLVRLACYVTPLLAIQVAKEVFGDMHVLDRLSWWGKGILFLIMAVLLATAGASGGRTFIYFQF